MRLGSRRIILGVLGTAAAWSLSVAMISGQAPPAAPAPAPQAPAGGAGNPVLAEQAFKNVTVLRGTTVQEFMGAMGLFSAALGMSCEDCHAADDRNWDGFAAENPRKQRARQMVLMTQQINRANFGGRQLVTCYGCHRGDNRPKPTPTMDDVYGGFPPNNPPDIITQDANAPTPDSVFDKYLQAIGGAQRAAAIKSLSGTGVSVGYGPEEEPRKAELYAVAPDKRTTVIHTTSGDATTVYNGKQAWYAAPYRPVPVLELTKQDFESARVEAMSTFPAQIKTIATNWRVGRPFTLGTKDVVHVQGTSTDGVEVSLYFDPDTGLLLRQTRYTSSPVGLIPTQVDYDDYREVNGVKIPFKWTVSGINGRDTFEMQTIQANANIPEARFARPAPPAAVTARPVRN